MIMRGFKHLLCLVIITSVFSCTEKVPEYTTLDSGLKFRFIDNKEGDLPQIGDVLVIDMNHTLEDSVLYESDKGNGYILNPNTGAPDNLREVLNLCSEGDSVQIQMSLGEYSKLTRLPITPETDTAQMVTWNIRVNEIENESTLIERKEKEQVTKDVELIKEFVVNNNLEAQATEEGLYYVISKKGNGQYPKIGDQVFVSYTLTLLDGTIIDTSNEELAKENNLFNADRKYGPLSFELGGTGIIRGWNIGIPKVSKGGKGKLLIPSSYGWGARGSGAQILPNTITIFDVEVVDIK